MFTGNGLLAGVVNVQTGPVVVFTPSVTSTYHSYSVNCSRDGHCMQVSEPAATLEFVPIKVNASDRFTGREN